MNLAVLASHGGSVLQEIMDRCADQTIPNTQITVVICNNSQALALQRARKSGIPTRHISQKTHPDETARDNAVKDALTEAAADWVMLAGYMKKLGPQTIAAFHHRIINTHPALLPEFGGQGFYGRRVHEAVIASGADESGATMHFVVGEYDTGPIVSRIRLPVLPDDTAETLEDRVKTAERKLVINTLAELASQPQASNYS